MIISGQQVTNALNDRKYILMEVLATTDTRRKCSHYKEIYNTFSPILKLRLVTIFHFQPLLRRGYGHFGKWATLIR
jgi:hypothetical protein